MNFKLLLNSRGYHKVSRAVQDPSGEAWLPDKGKHPGKVRNYLSQGWWLFKCVGCVQYRNAALLGLPASIRHSSKVSTESVSSYRSQYITVSIKYPIQSFFELFSRLISWEGSKNNGIIIPFLPNIKYILGDHSLFFSLNDTGGRYFSQFIIFERSLIRSSIVDNSIRLLGKYLECSKDSPKAHKRFSK